MIRILWRLLKIRWIKAELRFVNAISRHLEESNRKENLRDSTVPKENKYN